MSDEGWKDFEDYGLHAELKTLWQNGKTGVLNSEIDGFEKSLYLKDGAVVFASSNDPDEKLPQVLIGQGRFSEDQFNSVLPNFKEEISVGRNLVEMGLITQQELVQGAKEQVFRVFANMLNSERGRSDFTEEDLPQGVVSLPLVFPNDFIRALMENEDKTWIAAQFGDNLDFVCSRHAENTIDFNKVDVGEYAGAIYDLIDGERDFNHLVFEAGVDELTLFKFLYTLRLLDYITIETSETESEEEPQEDFAEPPVVDTLDDFPDDDLGDIREELNSALDQDDEINKLGQIMDETVALPKEIIEEEAPIGSMEPTMELDKSAMGIDAALAEAADEVEDVFTASEEEPVDSFEHELPDETDLINEEDPGLDDLGGMSDDVFEQTLERDDDEDFEYEEETEGKSKKAPVLILAAAGLVFAGALFVAMPHIMNFFMKPDPLPSPEEELAVMDQAEEQDPPLIQTVDPEEQAAVIETPPQTVPSEVELANDQPPQDQAEVEVAQLEPETVEATPDPVPSEPEPVQPDPEPEPVQIDPVTDQPVDVQEPPVKTQPKKDNVARRGFHSPVADNWENRPPRRAQLAAPESGETAAAPPPTSNQADASEDNTIETVTSNNPAPITSNSTPVQTSPPAASGSIDDARNSMAAGDYDSAAQVFRSIRANEARNNTVVLFMACQKDSIDKAIAATSNDPDLFLLPKTYRGQKCYWVCWGSFPSRLDALKTRDNLPEGLLADKSPEVKRLGSLTDL